MSFVLFMGPSLRRCAGMQPPRQRAYRREAIKKLSDSMESAKLSVPRNMRVIAHCGAMREPRHEKAQGGGQVAETTVPFAASCPAPFPVWPYRERGRIGPLNGVAYSRASARMQ